MKLLWLLGKKLYNYDAVKYNTWGRFENQYMINEKLYRRKKWNALEYQKKEMIEVNKFKIQRDKLFYILYESLDIKQVEIAKMCKDVGIVMDRSNLSKIITHIKGEEDKKEIFLIENSSNNGNGG